MDPIEELAFAALRGGVETTLAEVISLKGLTQDQPLTSVRLVADYLSELELEFIPVISTGELSTPRQLRRKSTAAERVQRVLTAVAGGETSRVEFKESMFANMRRWKGEGLLEEHQSLHGESLKSVAALMNTTGGELVVGVSDSQTLSPGIRKDLEVKEWDSDKWQLHWESLLDTRFAVPGSVRRFLDYRLLQIDGELVFHVMVTPSPRPVFVRRTKGGTEEFFVRQGPRTRSLSLVEFADHFDVLNSLNARYSNGG